jgi:uncharacterized protein (TIGR03085 family)
MELPPLTMVPMTTDDSVPVARAERRALCDTFLELGPAAPTLCHPWLTRELAAHLVLRERRPDLAAGMWVRPLKGHLERGQARIADSAWTQLVDTVRDGPPWWTPMHFAKVDALVNTSEFVIHHEDVLRGDGAVGPRREVPERTAQAVLSVLRSGASVMVRRSPVGVRLVAPGAEPISAGPKAAVAAGRLVTVTGEPVELLLLAAGRIRVADVVLDGAPEDVLALKGASLGV